MNCVCWFLYVLTQTGKRRSTPDTRPQQKLNTHVQYSRLSLWTKGHVNPFLVNTLQVKSLTWFQYLSKMNKESVLVKWNTALYTMIEVSVTFNHFRRTILIFFKVLNWKQFIDRLSSFTLPKLFWKIFFDELTDLCTPGKKQYLYLNISFQRSYCTKTELSKFDDKVYCRNIVQFYKASVTSRK